MLYTSPNVLTSAQRRLILEITGTQYNPVLADLAKAAGWKGVRRLKADIILRANAQIGSKSISIPSLRTGLWPAGSDVRLILEAPVGGHTILAGHGGGGKAIIGGYYPDKHLGEAENGGPAFQAEAAITVENYGIIGGGGGGSRAYNDGYREDGAGGGGAGLDAGRGGSGWKYLDGHGWGGAESGTDGSSLAGGVGGGLPRRPSPKVTKFLRGGKGGNLGQPGESYGGPAGTSGPAIVGDRFITWAMRGDLRGPVEH